MTEKKEDLSVLMDDYMKTLEEFTTEKTTEAINSLKQAFRYKQSMFLFLRVCGFFSIGLLMFIGIYLFANDGAVIKGIIGAILAVILIEVCFVFMSWYVFMYFLFGSDNILVTIKTKFEFSRNAKIETRQLLEMVTSVEKKLEEEKNGK